MNVRFVHMSALHVRLILWANAYCTAGKHAMMDWYTGDTTESMKYIYISIYEIPIEPNIFPLVLPVVFLISEKVASPLMRNRLLSIGLVLIHLIKWIFSLVDSFLYLFWSCRFFFSFILEYGCSYTVQFCWCVCAWNFYTYIDE